MKRVSGTAARCNEFFPQVLPLSLIFVAAVKTRTTKAGRPLNRLWPKRAHYGDRNVLRLSNARVRCGTTRIKDFGIDSLS